jgi:acetylornithine deacetylase/succinyl-diaminopimelate desuccinylase-like protein
MVTGLDSGSKRVFERLDELYAIGAGEGANRIGGSPEEGEAHRLAAAWMAEAGLQVDADAAGNLVGRLPGTRPDLPEVWTGSHLDSVPRGGRFDGALGVVAGLEAVERLGSRERTLAVVVFRDEERGCVGSRALAARGGGFPGAFVETHVEQGPALELAGAPLGLVTGIVGIARGELAFAGRAGHAGTTPMSVRSDALCAAAEFVLALRDAARRVDGAVATVGELEVEPGAVNVIPARVRLSYDVRAPDRGRLETLLELVPEPPSYRTEPVALAGAPVDALRAELERLGPPVVELVSGAGHDAAILAAAGVPTAMLFVRSLNGGVSHSPEEESSPEDVALAVGVLTGALDRLAREFVAQSH